MCSGRGDKPLRLPGFPIRTSPDQSLVADSPGLIAGSYVLLRLLVPRHPPCALINLATTDARVHYAVLKIRAVPAPLVAANPDTGHCPEMNSGVPPCGAVRRDVGPDRGGCRSARSLRTQQRARPAPPAGLAFLPASGCTSRAGPAGGPNNQCSTGEHPSLGSPQADAVGFQGVAPRTNSDACSLERR
jgi:hypothetical protein